ncbi:hypothetical protein JV175_03455, partial [Mycoplasma gypis]|nr:hypothetical protein [[Mycoplasma] gypis]
MENNVYKLIDNSIEQNKKIQTILFSTTQNVNLDPYLLYFINHIQSNYFTDSESLLNSKNCIVINAIKTINKEDITDAIMRISASSDEESNVLVIKNIENGSASSLNALLKFLESLPENVFVVMTTKNKYRVLSTIISRSVLIDINFKDKEKIQKLDLLRNSMFKEFWAYLTDDEEFINAKYNEETENNLQNIFDAFNSLDDKKFLAKL